MDKTLKVGNHILVHKKPYEIVGIDSYSLQNHFRKSKSWKSYTLVGKNERIGLSIMDNNLTLWSTIVNHIDNGKFNFEMSGIASITFEGDKGPSTPLAELTWFDLRNKDLNIFLIERFLSYASNNELIVNTFYQVGKVIKITDLQMIDHLKCLADLNVS